MKENYKNYRIGNLVNHIVFPDDFSEDNMQTETHLSEVIGFDYYEETVVIKRLSNGEIWDTKDIQPIELTKTIIDSFDFNYEEGFSPNDDLLIDFRNQKIQPYMAVLGWDCTPIGLYFREIKFTHELQNMYWGLKGEELLLLLTLPKP